MRVNCIICIDFRIFWALKNPETRKNMENSHAWIILVLGLRYQLNFGDCSILSPFFPRRLTNRQQRLVPFNSMPNLRSQNEVISELWIETAWCSFLSSSALLLTPLQLFSPPPLSSTAVRLSSTAVPLSSSTTAVPLSYSIANLPPKLHRRLIRHLTIHRTDSAHSRTDRPWTPHDGRGP